MIGNGLARLQAALLGLCTLSCEARHTELLSSESTSGPFDDFPPDPIESVEGGELPPRAGEVFANSDSGMATADAPCLLEPAPGVLYPRNLLRPTFRWRGSSADDTFELRLHSDREANDLRVHTSASQWRMPEEMWRNLVAHLVGEPIQVSLRSAQPTGPARSLLEVSQAAKSSFSIAPADAGGTIVYWATTGKNPGPNAIRRLSLDRAQASDVLDPSQAQALTDAPGDGGPFTCVACHSVTPDGSYLGVASGYSPGGPYGESLFTLSADVTSGPPSFITAAARAALAAAQIDPLAFSAAHWRAADRRAIGVVGSDADAQLAWFDFEADEPAKATGTLRRGSDARPVALPSWSHDGRTIAYVSNRARSSSNLQAGEADIYVVPYNEGQGGEAMPVAGAADPALAEYYPAFSPDDQWLVFNRIPIKGSMYDSPVAEVFLVPTGGGEATRIVANDPPACSGRMSPGVRNSRAAWSPKVVGAGSDLYRWLVFSSDRDEEGRIQLYATAVVETAGVLRTFPPFHLSSQASNENNLSPVWSASPP